MMEGPDCLWAANLTGQSKHDYLIRYPSSSFMKIQATIEPISIVSGKYVFIVIDEEPRVCSKFWERCMF